MFSEQREFDYEPPSMSYDKKTGEINIQAKKAEKKKKVIGSMDDLQREKKALFAEMGLDDEGKPKAANEPVDKLADKIKGVQERMRDEFDLDPSAFHVFSRDFLRVDVGLLIQRPPIFLTMRQRDVEFLKYKSDIMNEYYCNTRQFTEQFEEISKLNEDVLGDNPYSSKQNLDNYPTHRMPGAQPGDSGAEYCAASKYYQNVDPTMEDRRTLHYAGEDRTYMIVRNRYTQEWEFPTAKMNFGQTFMRAKQNLFKVLAAGASNDDAPGEVSGTSWKVKYFGQAPIAATIRELTEAEKQDKMNHQLKGVRTFYFQAHHWRGLPSLSKLSEHDYDDFAWVPKRKMNEYFTKDYFEIFAKACLTR
jgi:hypothetical protein